MILEKNSKYFPKESVFVIQILDVVFEVETEFYTCLSHEFRDSKSQSCVPYEKTGSEYWEKIHGLREIIRKYFAVMFVSF
jgi:hypothetical protein